MNRLALVQSYRQRSAMHIMLPKLATSGIAYNGAFPNDTHASSPGEAGIGLSAKLYNTQAPLVLLLLPSFNVVESFLRRFRTRIVERSRKDVQTCWAALVCWSSAHLADLGLGWSCIIRITKVNCCRISTSVLQKKHPSLSF